MLCFIAFALFNALTCSAVTLTTTITQDGCPTSRKTTATGQSPPKSSSTGTAHPVLSPAVHWDQDLGDLAQLLPSTSGQLYYSEGGTGDPSVAAMVAHLQVNYTFPSVVLEHSSLIAQVTCNAGGLQVVLSSQAAAQHAIDLWSPSIVLVTHAEECGKGVPGDRSYFLVETLRLVHSTIMVSGKAIDIDQAMIDVELVWGAYTPSNADGSSVPNAASTTPLSASMVPSSPGETFVATSTPAVSPPEVSSSVDFPAPPGTSAAGTSSAFPAPEPTTSAPTSPVNGSSDACGTPASSIINGSPAAPCGPDFDTVLDDALGYYNVDDDESFAASFAEMAPGSTYQDTGDSSSITDKRSLMVLQKRWGFSSFVSAVSSAVVSTVRNVVQTVVPAVVNVVQQAARTVVQVATTIVNTPFSPSVRFNVPVNVVARANQNSPFGPAFQIYRYRVPDNDPAKRGFQQRLDTILDQLLPDPGGPPAPGVVFYCIDCGITGSVAVAGSVSFTLLNGINAGNIGISGNLRAGIQIGLDALVGPEVTLDLKADFAISAQGQLLAGIIATWPAFNANLDFVNPSRSTQSGFVPRIERIFNAKGTLTASTSLGLPLGLAFGIDLLNGRYAKTIALINTPAIGAEASFTAAYGANSGGSIGDGTCPGVAWSIGLSNKLELNVLDLRTYPLYTWNSPPLADGCPCSPSAYNFFLDKNFIFFADYEYIVDIEQIDVYHFQLQLQLALSDLLFRYGD
ncbi:MAG: hypothetical protein Q9174_002673 [Haloplaca sp. 1 TL-2023]